MGKSRFTTSSRKKQHIPTGAVCVEQSIGKLSSAPLDLAPGLKLAKKRNYKTARQISQNDTLTLQSVKPALSEDGLGKGLFQL